MSSPFKNYVIIQVEVISLSMNIKTLKKKISHNFYNFKKLKWINSPKNYAGQWEPILYLIKILQKYARLVHFLGPESPLSG